MLAGINATDQPKTIELDLSKLGATEGGTLITDGDSNRSFSTKAVADRTLPVRGGFAVQPQ